MGRGGKGLGRKGGGGGKREEGRRGRKEEGRVRKRGREGREKEKDGKKRKRREFLCCYTPHTLVPIMALMKVQFSCTSSGVTTSASPVEVS